MQIGANKFKAGDNPVMDEHPIQGGGEILVIIDCSHCSTGRHLGLLMQAKLFIFSAPSPPRF